MKLYLITEADSGRIFNFDYNKFKTDPRPRLLLLGKWRHPSTKKTLLAGINLHYLDDNQIIDLRKQLPYILEPRNLKSRYWRGREVLPDIFNDSYRTYDRNEVGTITKDTLKFYKSPEELEKAEIMPAKPSIKPSIEPSKPSLKPSPEIEVEPEKELDVEPEVKLKPTMEEPPAEQEEPKTSPESVKGTAPVAEVEPEVAEAPIERSKSGEPEEQGSEPSSVQRRMPKAQEIKKEIEKQKLTNPPPPPEPPEEIKGAMGMFKKP